MKRREFTLAVTTVSTSVVAVLIVAEVVLHFLPVCTGMRANPVNAKSPILRYESDQDFVYSKGWNLAIVNRGHINNRGFVNDQDYSSTDQRHLLTVIGDSFVEAAMVPYEHTLQGSLQGVLDQRARVYSFGVSGAALSDYLAFARYARDQYQPTIMLFNIVGNDFDESLPKYKSYEGGHYQYVPNQDGKLILKRMGDYEISAVRRLIAHSALVRYVFFNLEAARAYQAVRGVGRKQDADSVGNTMAEASRQRVDDATAVVTAFFRDLPEYSGLPAGRVMFVVDAVREGIYGDVDEATVKRSFFYVMRQEFIAAASQRGYEVVDLQRYFAADFRYHGRRFEFPTDGHWNSLGHAVAARAVQEIDDVRAI